MGASPSMRGAPLYIAWQTSLIRRLTTATAHKDPRRSGPHSGKCARGDQRNTSAMMAAIKPNVASQLTVPINSSVMGQCPPAVSDGA